MGPFHKASNGRWRRTIVEELPEMSAAAKKKRGADAAVRREMPTIREVAKLAGVGLMTVSRVINEQPTVRPKTRKKVLAAIQELGYERNEAAGLLKGQRAMMIGLIVPDLSDIFFASCANTIERLARESGYMTLIVSSGHDMELEIQQAELMARRKLSGLLLVTSGRTNPERISRLIAGGLAVVAFDRPLDGVRTDAVLVENRSGAEEAVNHLIGHGHRRIACLGCDEAGYPVQERISGYRNVMLANGLRPNLSMNIDSMEAATAWLDEALGKPDTPTAIFSTNYRTSALVLRALSEKRVKIPSAMALIGFDDFDLATVIAPPLTTVGQSPVDLARRAFRLLIDRIRGAADGVENAPEKIMLPATLIVRESCGCHAKSQPAGTKHNPAETRGNAAAATRPV
jgi:LacI family transcriptional regulator